MVWDIEAWPLRCCLALGFGCYVDWFGTSRLDPFGAALLWGLGRCEDWFGTSRLDPLFGAALLWVLGVMSTGLGHRGLTPLVLHCSGGWGVVKTGPKPTAMQHQRGSSLDVPNQSSQRPSPQSNAAPKGSSLDVPNSTQHSYKALQAWAEAAKHTDIKAARRSPHRPRPVRYTPGGKAFFFFSSGASLLHQ